jgi:transcriptional regulator with XRE-family HTH domain
MFPGNKPTQRQGRGRANNYNPIPGSIQDRVQQRLDALGETDSAVSIRAGLSSSFIRDIMRNRERSPQCASIAKIAPALQTTPEWLAFAVGTPRARDESLDLDLLAENLTKTLAGQLPLREARRTAQYLIESSYEPESPRSPQRSSEKLSTPSASQKPDRR